MDRKSKYNLEKTKLTNFFIGLTIFCGITLGAFSYRVNIDTGIRIKRLNHTSELTYEEVEIPKETQNLNIPKTEVAKPQQEIDLTQEIKVVENKNEEQKETIIETIEIVVKEETVEVTEIVEPVVDFPDIEAEFIGGEDAMQKWMQQNLVYPQEAMEMGEQGKVYLKFVVEKDGSISNVDVIGGVSRDLDNEARRLVRIMPIWKPGESLGIKVRSSFTMPINFQLQ